MTTMHYFSVGNLSNRQACVDGGHSIRLPLIREMLKLGVNVHWMGIERGNPQPNSYVKLLGLDKSRYLLDMSKRVSRTRTPKKGDFLLCEMRPNIDKLGYKFQEEFKLMMAHVTLFLRHNLGPVFIWDQDFWHQYIPANIRKKVILLEPYETNVEVFPDRHKFFFFKPENKQKLPEKKLFDLVYCGNVYGRREMFIDFMKPVHDMGNKQVLVTGNWMRKKYGDRDVALDNLPNFMWIGKSEQWTTMPLLAMAKATFNVENDWQRKVGMITSRTFEAIEAGIPCFVNKDIYNIEKHVPKSLLVTYKNFAKKFERADYEKEAKKLAESLKEHTASNRALELVNLYGQYK